MKREFFKNPRMDANYSISPFWFWNDLITDEQTTEQMKMMKRINAGQPVIHSRHGLVNEYLSQDWFDRVDNAIQTAKENDMRVWLYDEDNWPSGNCGWTITENEESREHFLQINKIILKAGEDLVVCTKEKKYINITAYRKDQDNGIDLLISADKLGKINYNATEDMEIYYVNVAVNSYEPFGKFCVDYLSKKQIKTFIESTHEKYYARFKEEFGKTIRGIFMDETRFFNALPWTETLLEEFKTRKGYDLLPNLPLLIKDTPKSKFIRYDYYDVVADMVREATYKQIYDWCEERGVETTGHFLGEETLATQSRFNADMMRMYRDFHVPGIDHLGNGIGSLNAKMCSSAAYNYGKNVIGCEAFGASGWDITFEEMVKISNWLFQQGINLIMVHGFYYSIRDERKDDFPPSYFHQWKYWDQMPMYSDMAARMSNMLQDGTSEIDVLVYYPVETFWNYFKPDFKIQTCYWKDGPEICNEQAKFMDNQFQLLCSTLLNKNLDFNVLNSDATHNFKVENGKIINKLNGMEFSIFVLPLVEILPEPMVKLLNEFVAQGGKVISYKSDVQDIVGKSGEHFTEKEFKVLNTSNYEVAEKIGDIARCVENAIQLPFEIICGVDEVSRSQMSYPDQLHDPYIHDGEQQYGVGVTRYVKDGKRILNFTNYNNKDEDLVVSVISSDIPEIFIPETGEIIKVANYTKQDKGYEFAFTLPKNRVYFIVCDIR